MKITDELIKIIWLLITFLGGAIFSGLTMKYNWFSILRRPIDCGAQVRGRRLFGDNKTFRGIFTMAVGTSFGMWIQAVAVTMAPRLSSLCYFEYSFARCLLVGAAMGLCGTLSELPNSFSKRQLGVAPGKSAMGFWLPFFFVLDQIDLLAGMWIALAFVMDVTVQRIVLSVLVTLVGHQLVSFIGYIFGMRKSIR